MTILEYLRAYQWDFDTPVIPDDWDQKNIFSQKNKRRCHWMSVFVAFEGPDGLDETSFDIKAFARLELYSLFRNFCKENGLPDDTVCYVGITAMAETYNQLVALTP